MMPSGYLNDSIILKINEDSSPSKVVLMFDNNNFNIIVEEWRNLKLQKNRVNTPTIIP